MTLAEIIAGLRARASQTVPWTGEAIGELKRGASYIAGKNGTLGVPVYQSGGKLRTASIDIARRLGVEDAVVAPTANQPAEITAPPLTIAAPVIPSAAPKSAPAARKPPAPKTVAARKAPAPEAAAPRQARRQARSPEAVS